jgi:hypothetical protein
MIAIGLMIHGGAAHHILTTLHIGTIRLCTIITRTIIIAIPIRMTILEYPIEYGTMATLEEQELHALRQSVVTTCQPAEEESSRHPPLDELTLEQVLPFEKVIISLFHRALEKMMISGVVEREVIDEELVAVQILRMTTCLATTGEILVRNIARMSARQSNLSTHHQQTAVHKNAVYRIERLNLRGEVLRAILLLLHPRGVLLRHQAAAQEMAEAVAATAVAADVVKNRYWFHYTRRHL